MARLTRKEAEVALAEMMADLPGYGWTGEVWENLGWHYAAKNGYLSVYPSFGGEYIALLSDDRTRSGSPSYWTDHEHYETPTEAAIGSIVKAFEFVESRVAVVEEVLKIFGGQE